MEYQEFLKQKIKIASSQGFKIELDEINPRLKPHNKLMVRKDDVSGTADLTNAVENVFLIHRVNKDFIRRSGDFFGEDIASQYYKFGNVIEVAKNRDLGIVDHLVGLYYEIESKRFLNDFTDNYCYGWQDLLREEEPHFGLPSFNFSISEQEFLSEPTLPDNMPF